MKTSLVTMNQQELSLRTKIIMFCVSKGESLV